MKIGIIVNPRAGKVNVKSVKEKIRKALFRCELLFFSENGVERLENFLKKSIKEKISHLIVVGGDGTLNLTINSLAKIDSDFHSFVPPVCLISMGTANDLAFEMGINKRIEKAARLIYEGEVMLVDLLRVESENVVKYMITNGGVGVTAETARTANDLREYFRDRGTKLGLQRGLKSFGQSITRSLGSNIYHLVLFYTWKKHSGTYSNQITVNGKETFNTASPFVLVNNQKTLARKFSTAPSTVNNDGKFNLLVIQNEKSLQQLKQIINFSRGRWIESEELISREVESLEIRSQQNGAKLSFIGDGEVLFFQKESIKIEIVHPGLPILVNKEQL